MKIFRIILAALSLVGYVVCREIFAFAVGISSDGGENLARQTAWFLWIPFIVILLIHIVGFVASMRGKKWGEYLFYLLTIFFVPLLWFVLLAVDQYVR